MTNTQHFINAIQRAQETNMMIIKNGEPGSNDYVIINDDKAYNVSIHNGLITRCTCPHNTFRGVTCKHMVKLSLEKEINIASLGGVDTSEETSLEVV